MTNDIVSIFRAVVLISKFGNKISKTCFSNSDIRENSRQILEIYRAVIENNVNLITKK